MSIRPVALCLLLLGSFAVPCMASFEPVTCKNAFTVPQEIAEGNKVAAQIYAQMPVLPDSDPVSRYVQQLGLRLTASAPPPPGTNEHWPFNFHVVASEEINAFALPGGSVFVNLGTIQAAQTEAQLAGVMAHEISHVILRHSTCNLSRQQHKQLLYGIGGILSSVLLGNGAAGSLAQAGIGFGQNLDFLHMSRDDERQADLLGVNILSNAGFDPRGLPQFFETIQAKYGSGGAQLLSDHPNPGNRTEYVNAEIATLPRRPHPVVTSPAFTAMHTQATNEHALTSKEIQTGAWKRSGLYAAGPGATVLPISAPGSSTPVSPPPPLSSASSGSAPTASSRADLHPLDRRALALSSALTTLAAPSFSLRYPSAWQRSDDPAGSAITLAPAGGVSAQGIAYGVLITPSASFNRGITDSAGLSDATSDLVQKFIATNPGLAQTGTFQPITVSGHIAYGVDLTGRSPLSEGGNPLPEHDWLITVARSDGTFSYLVFIAPESDFATLKPTFSAMAASFKPT